MSFRTKHSLTRGSGPRITGVSCPAMPRKAHGLGRYDRQGAVRRILQDWIIRYGYVEMKERAGVAMRVLLVIVLIATSAVPVLAQSFSCPIGSKPACLSYGDKVVDSDAKCFNGYTCDFNGFMCKSDHDEYVKKAVQLLNAYEGLRDCIVRSSTVEDAKACNLYY